MWARARTGPAPEMYAHALVSRDVPIAHVEGCWVSGHASTHTDTNRLPSGPVHTLPRLPGPVHTYMQPCQGCPALTQHTRACTPLPGLRGAPTDRQLWQGVGGRQPRAAVARDMDVGPLRLPGLSRQLKKVSDHSRVFKMP